ncbi:hypothetical protein DFQ29_004111 [Apophysomyces sp. BC1021]|nr:hypothetical protein DFQ29_004110 [Apophysomyces sp. BC1021]KAG0177978.1 hypothetical protein DFQ29_004111 [Apophysomyces sp. BC1021]
MPLQPMIAKEKYEAEWTIKDDDTDLLLEWCDQMELQFRRIQSASEESSLDRVQEYTKDGLEFIRVCRHRHLDTLQPEQSVYEIPVARERTPDGLPDIHVYDNPDYKFVIKFKESKSQAKNKVYSTIM